MLTHVFITRFETATVRVRKQVWDAKRLERRFLAFEGFNYPSVINQYSRYPFYWILIVDKDMPKIYHRRLHKIIDKHDNIFTVDKNDVTNRPSLDWIKRIVPKHNNRYFITSRIDNDDALSNGYIDKIHQWVEKNPIKDFRILYHPHGLIWGSSNRSYPYGSVTDKEYQYISTGLSLICTQQYPLSVLVTNHVQLGNYIDGSRINDTYLKNIWLKNKRHIYELNSNNLIVRLLDKNMYIWVWHGANTSQVRDRYPKEKMESIYSLHHYRNRFTLDWDKIKKLTVSYK